MTDGTRRCRQILARLAAGLCGLALLATAAAADYRLSPGDRVRITIPELPNAQSEAVIDIDGNLRAPRLGTFRAAGLTLSELQNEVGLASAGRIVSLFTSAGERLEVALDGTETLVEIVGYRPVYLTGHVARPGAIDYQPGMTVRAAIASASGTAPVPAVFDDAVMQIPDLQGAYQTRTLEHAAAVVRRWGLDAILSADTNRAPPAQAEVFVGRPVLDRLIAAERERVRLALEAYEATRRAQAQRMHFLSEGVARLQTTLAHQEAALRLEEEDVERIRKLAGRGLASAARLSDARQALLLVASRVLEAQDSLARLTLQKQELAQEIDTFAQSFRQPLLAERAGREQDAWQGEARIAAVRQSLALYGEAARSVGSVAEPVVTLSIRRRTGDEVEALDVAMDDPVLPGDVVDVEVRYTYPSFMSEPPAAPAPTGEGGPRPGREASAREPAATGPLPEAAPPAGAVQPAPAEPPAMAAPTAGPAPPVAAAMPPVFAAVAPAGVPPRKAPGTASATGREGRARGAGVGEAGIGRRQDAPAAARTREAAAPVTPARATRPAARPSDPIKQGRARWAIPQQRPKRH